ncbi:A24 family peptidase [Ferrimonas balearica]|uniref:A24 family peptidase n=1 Tax=Ferrimonas balearica TaxID=44012 RepID=UPI001C97DA4D|nr:A24 family peptidase [Ferrimonas balearica]MBY5980649.1 A24 family peptidase [Ferrimonas balearica]
MSSITPYDSVQTGLIVVGFALALVCDLRTQRIPNVLALLALFSGLSFHLYHSGLAGAGIALAGAAVALLMVPLYAKGFIGAGDVKLMMGMGALMGPVLSLWVLALGIVCGALVAPLLAVNQVGWDGLTATAKRYYQCFITRQYFAPEQGEAAATRVPYAPALAMGWVLTQWLSLPGL